MSRKGKERLKLVIRGFLLFNVGIVFTVLFNLLQVQRVTNISNDIVETLFASSWWLMPSCGCAAVIVGLLYPLCDSHFGDKHHSEWTNVIRCVALFIGINHGSAKIDFTNNLQFALTLAAMSIGLWWLFDRSRSGFSLGVLVALLAACLSQFLVICGFIVNHPAEFLYIRSWLPCMFFTGGVTVGNIGRQLATYNFGVDVKEHEE